MLRLPRRRDEQRRRELGGDAGDEVDRGTVPELLRAVGEDDVPLGRRSAGRDVRPRFLATAESARARRSVSAL
jgi:hypothetical protein